jgi:carnitine 3-dehydrogenase
MLGPRRFCVGHPFNPVYLLPLVEVVGGEATAAATIERAAAVYRSVGMHPLHVRNEIDGFVADRLLEALWREALWLVHDGVATVSEIDDAIRYGAGLRWSFMGTFLTYRIAGGEAGMRHFMSQFGPAPKWPWSKLVDVPELTDDLLDRLVAQSDAQAAGRSLRELERVRDDCLVAVLQGLRSQSFGAGTVLDTYERELVGRARAQAPDAVDLTAPLVLHHAIVPPEWTDYNGHLHESRYLQVLGDASDALFRFVGVDTPYLAAGRSFYTVETHLCFLREVLTGDRLEVAIQVLGADEKRIHAFLELRREDGEVVATAEHLYLHVDSRAGKASPAEPAVAGRIEQLRAAQAALPTPSRAGRRIGLTER